jgi:hypothetical protein
MMPPFISVFAALFFLQTQAPKPLLSGDDGWVGLGDVAKVSRVATDIKFEYEVDPRSMNLLALPVQSGVIAGAEQLQFSVKAESDAPLGISLQEENGGRYTAFILVQKNIWQKIQLAASDFILNHDPNDPKDTNNTLDMDKVNGIAIVDINQLFVKNDGIKALFAIKAGPQSFSIKEFSVLSAPKLAASLDGLARPQLGWIGVGGGTVKKVSPESSPLSVASVSLSYESAPLKIAGLIRALPAKALSNKKQLRFSAAVQKSTSLLVQLEDDLGGKFQTTLEVPGVRSPKTLTINFADLKTADDSKTQKFDAARVKTLIIADISGITESVEQSNTLWLARLEIN